MRRQSFYGRNVRRFDPAGGRGSTAAAVTAARPARWPKPYILSAAAINSTPRLITRLPPPALRASASGIGSRASATRPPGADGLAKNIEHVARRPKDLVAGQNPPAIAVRRLIGPVAADLAGRGVDPPQMIAAGDQIALADAQQMDRVGGERRFPQRLARAGVEGQDRLAVGRGDEQGSLIIDAGIQVAIEMGQRVCPGRPRSGAWRADRC